MKNKAKPKTEKIQPKKKSEVKPEAKEEKAEVKELFDLEPEIEQVEYVKEVKEKALKKAKPVTKDIPKEKKSVKKKPEILKNVKIEPEKKPSRLMESIKPETKEAKPEKKSTKPEKTKEVKAPKIIKMKSKTLKKEVKSEKRIGGGSFIASGILSVTVPAIFYTVLGDFNSFLKDCSLPFSTVDIGNSTIVNCNEIRLVYVISILCVFFGLILIIWGLARKMSEQS